MSIHLNKKFEIGEIVLEIKNPFLKLKIESITNNTFSCSIVDDFEKNSETRKIFLENELIHDDSIAVQ